MNKIWEIVLKEWGEVFKNGFVLFTVAFLPLMFTAMPLFILNSMVNGGDISGASGFSDMPEAFGQVCGGLSDAECGQVFIVTQFLVLFLIMPIMIPVTFASYSIVGEKTTRTLEPLLATPVTTIELLSGKALAAGIPAMAATWGAYILFGVGASFITTSQAVVQILLKPHWLMAIFALGPLLSIAGISLAVMISSRVNEPRVAEQLSALVVLPVMALFMGQSFGLIQVNQDIIIWMILGLFGIDIALLYFASKLFQRETILTRWK